MQKINDLSDLLVALSSKTADSLEISLDPSLFEGLKGCLELGLKHIMSFEPMAVNPRQLVSLDDGHGMPTRRVNPKDFQKYLEGSLDSKPDPVLVNKDLLAEGIGWVKYQEGSPRLNSVIDPMELKISSTADDKVEVHRPHLQEIVDWLDLIQRTRPNEVAKELRKSVSDLNEKGLKRKIKTS